MQILLDVRNRRAGVKGLDDPILVLAAGDQEDVRPATLARPTQGLAQVDAVHLEVYDLADPEPRSVQEHHQRAVALHGVSGGGGEARTILTVSATGLDGVEGRTRPPKRRFEDDVHLPSATRDNVMPLHSEANAAAPGARARQTSPETEDVELDLESAASSEAQSGKLAGEGFASPFEDEFDAPAFLRKRKAGSEDDTDEPAFLRRAQD